MSYLNKLVFNKIRIKNSFGQRSKDELLVLAEITNGRQIINIFAKSWKNVCRDEEEYFVLFYQNIIHETLHGVIDSIAEEDELDVVDNHWPHLHGMDEPYANDWE